MLPVGLSEAVLSEEEQSAQYAENRNVTQGRTRAKMHNSPGLPTPYVSGIYVINGDGDTVYEGFWACGMRCGRRAPLA